VTLPVFVVAPESLRAALLPGDEVELGGAEGHHAATVKRMQVGERLMLTDGVGAGAECEAVAVNKRGLIARVVTAAREPEPEPRVTVVQAIPKGEHGELAIDLMSQVGVDRVVPWPSARTIANWQGERAEKALGKWRSTAVAAGKQARRLRFLEVAGVHDDDEVLALVGSASLALVLHETAEAPIASHGVPPGDVVLVVGPEGGLTEEEVRALTGAGAKAVRLGPSVLRTSSAGAVGAVALLCRSDRWA
jgi:16S rRNA (uracil1498-N3)-methyltransferase